MAYIIYLAGYNSMDFITWYVIKGWPILCMHVIRVLLQVIVVIQRMAPWADDKSYNSTFCSSKLLQVANIALDGSKFRSVLNS